MKKILLLLSTTMVIIYAECPTAVIANLDKISMQGLYKEIAYYAYLHKKKREYISKSYALLTDIRSVSATSMSGMSSTYTSMSTTPLLQMGVIESDILAVSNKVNLSLLNAIIFKSVKKEINEQFNTD